MYAQTSWLNSPKAKASLQASIAKDASKGLTAPDGSLGEPEEELAKLPVWQRTSTTRYCRGTFRTGAAILPKCPVADDELVRVNGWKTILKHIGKYVGGASVWRILQNVEYWSHRSTDGRWNEQLGRWERWGVMSVEKWRAPNLPPAPLFSLRTFPRAKAELVELGLIQAEVHIWFPGKGERPVRALWLRPTEKLFRILFEPGYWETVEGEYARAPKKPRGLSAYHACIEAELKQLYAQVVQHQLGPITEDERKEIFARLTEPVQLSAKHKRAPYVSKDSPEYQAIRECLNGANEPLTEEVPVGTSKGAKPHHYF